MVSQCGGSGSVGFIIVLIRVSQNKHSRIDPEPHSREDPQALIELVSSIKALKQLDKIRSLSGPLGTRASKR